MKREIKFRAWDENEKTMMYDDKTAEHDVEYWDGVNTSIVGMVNRQLSLNRNWMQFTGLKDKNGVEIYEGDVVKFHDHPTGVEDGIGKVYYKDGKWMVTWSMIPLGDFGTAWIEVIGNIYSNPELIN